MIERLIQALEQSVELRWLVGWLGFFVLCGWIALMLAVTYAWELWIGLREKEHKKP